MKRAVAAWTIIASLLSLNAGAEDRTIRFSGEVAQKLEFRKDIGHGLDFVLSPDTMGGGITGWTIEVTPHGKPPDPECTDYAWVVTPPFRFDNPRYLSTSYGNTAQVAVENSPREFNFVLKCGDYKAEYERVEKVLWPYNHPEKEVDDARAQLGQIRHGTGILRIKDSKYAPDNKTTNPPTFGEIHWIKFEAEIKFPTEAKH